jgi:hypothetical protein
MLGWDFEGLEGTKYSFSYIAPQGRNSIPRQAGLYILADGGAGHPRIDYIERAAILRDAIMELLESNTWKMADEFGAHDLYIRAVPHAAQRQSEFVDLLLTHNPIMNQS